ncbi:alternative ribosome rescue factor ArfA [Photobacterium leiognathi]|uniref:alternative ribosome rescue factor ArfA n=1 Tax=Photobacterium leiognathi TaxID=553611 RepID=UPI0029811B3E|nr:alternative ribosome rescue factor ArfA [Photobacterium leiognathi]
MKNLDYEHERGVISDNKLKAIITSKLFKTRQFKNIKGKGSYTRKSKHKTAYKSIVIFISRFI